MGTFIDLTGNRFGRLIAVRRDVSRIGAVYWECKCDCGNSTTVDSANLRSGHTKSCGCLREETDARHFLHRNQLKTDNPRLYSIWKSMRHRCYSEKHRSYNNYGGRGIKVCEEWLGENGFLAFVKWAENNGYSDSLTIDRINVDGNYCPDNCRWITFKENQNNKRDNRYIFYNGETKTLAQWAEEYNMTQCELKRRLDYVQLPIDIALTMKPGQKIEYNGKMLRIQNLAQRNNIPYNIFLVEVLRNGKSACDIIREYGR